MRLKSLLNYVFPQSATGPSDRDLADLGLSRMDYNLLAQSAPGTRERMESLAARFGVTPQMIDADRGLALELSETCGHCREAGACQMGLEGRAMFRTDRCPNATIYAEMAAG